MKRLNGIDIVVGLEIDETLKFDGSQDAVLHLGGERKLVKMSLSKINLSLIQNPTLNNGYFKIYLSTPCFFTKFGWKPDLQRFGINGKLIAASIGKSLNIGGFDLVSNQPKPMLKAVPAGSVYYYHSDTPSDSILEKLHGKSLSDYLPEQGYGISFIGQFNP